jgi:hypothetical protein
MSVVIESRIGGDPFMILEEESLPPHLMMSAPLSPSPSPEEDENDEYQPSCRKRIFELSQHPRTIPLRYSTKRMKISARQRKRQLERKYGSDFRPGTIRHRLNYLQNNFGDQLQLIEESLPKSFYRVMSMEGFIKDRLERQRSPKVQKAGANDDMWKIIVEDINNKRLSPIDEVELQSFLPRQVPNFRRLSDTERQSAVINILPPAISDDLRLDREGERDDAATPAEPSIGKKSQDTTGEDLEGERDDAATPAEPSIGKKSQDTTGEDLEVERDDAATPAESSIEKKTQDTTGEDLEVERDDAATPAEASIGKKSQDTTGEDLEVECDDAATPAEASIGKKSQDTTGEDLEVERDDAATPADTSIGKKSQETTGEDLEVERDEATTDVDPTPQVFEAATIEQQEDPIKDDCKAPRESTVDMENDVAPSVSLVTEEITKRPTLESEEETLCAPEASSQVESDIKFEGDKQEEVAGEGSTPLHISEYPVEPAIQEGKGGVAAEKSPGEVTKPSKVEDVASKTEKEGVIFDDFSSIKEDGKETDIKLCSSPNSVLDEVTFDEDEEKTEEEVKKEKEPVPLKRSRKIRFADEHGAPLTEEFLIKREANYASRIVVMLLSPRERKFEFLHAEYPLDASTTVQVLLEQVPELATNEAFRTKKFTALLQTETSRQLDNKLALEDYTFKESEIVLGIPDDFTAGNMAKMAVPLLLNKKLMKTVRQAIRKGRGLKTVKSGEEWRAKEADENSDT